MGLMENVRTAALAASLTATNLPAAPADAAANNAAGVDHNRADRFLSNSAPAMVQGGAIVSLSPKGAPTIAVNMGPSQPIKINGTPMPKGFEIGPHRDGIIFSKDLTQYAYIDAHSKAVLAKVPESGIVEVNGVRIDTKAGVTSNPNDRVDTFSVPAGPIASGPSTRSAPSASSSRGVAAVSSHLEKTDVKTGITAKFYDNITRVEIESSNPATIKLGRVDGTKVETLGNPKVGLTGLANKSETTETATVENGVLKIRNFGGVINLPPTTKEIKIHLKMGNVTGVVSTPGEITTGAGDITISIPDGASLGLQCSPGGGSRAFTPRAFTANGSGHLVSPAGESAGTLKLQTGFGKIQVRSTANTE